MPTSYFEKHGHKIQYVLSDEADEGYGLRRPQWRALQSIGSHFGFAETGENVEPALVVMPTGSGKTAVLKLAAFQERAERVLIVTPSQIVRNQIATRFSKLETLRKLNVFPEGEDIPPPRIEEQKSRIETTEGWEALREFDVVVGTPYSMSPAVKNVAEPPDDLFDLILVDEAHHKTATTWSKLLNSFPGARQIAFTATPYRRDEEQLDGRLIFHYKISQAMEDGIYSPIHFEAVTVDESDSDAAIARKAEEVFRRDRDDGLMHYLMARAKSKGRAKDLKEIYEAKTDLTLRVITSDHAYSRVETAIDDLINEDLDGVICVDMLGEGFDFPRLKIAAVHDPQKSLPVILQFVGRFARETDAETGDATFISTRSDIEVESTRIFNDSESWAGLISDLSEARVEQQAREQDFLDSFELVESRVTEVDKISPRSLTPFKSVKIYYTDSQVDITNKLDLLHGYNLIHRHVAEDEPKVTFFLTRSNEVVQWSRSTEPRNIEHNLFVVYHDADADLLFINASSKSSKMYASIADSVVVGSYKPLPLYRLKRVVDGIEKATFYNIGMRSRIQHSSTESYRTMAGPRTDRALARSDSRLYHQGHVFGGGERNDEAITIGYSSSAKVWSTSYTTIMGFVHWCQDLAQLISLNRDPRTGTGLDKLPTGTKIDQLPDHIIGTDWHPTIYQQPPEVETVVHGETQTLSILDLDLEACKSNNHIDVTVRAPSWTYELQYSPFNAPYFAPKSKQPNVQVIRGPARDNEQLADYLNDRPLSFFTPDFTRLEGEEEYDSPEYGPDNALLPDNRFDIVGWEDSSVDIRREFTDSDHQPREGYNYSIHDFLRSSLPEKHDVVFYDHTKGEAADFIAFDNNGTPTCTLYHCKSSAGDDPSARDGDIFEICGQAIKCLTYVGDFQSIVEHLRHRDNNVQLPEYVSGSEDEVKRIYESAQKRSFQFKVVLVQPGISKAVLAEADNLDKASQIASCDRYLRSSGADEVRIMCSS